MFAWEALKYVEMCPRGNSMRSQKTCQCLTTVHMMNSIVYLSSDVCCAREGTSKPSPAPKKNPFISFLQWGIWNPKGPSFAEKQRLLKVFPCLYMSLHHRRGMNTLAKPERRRVWARLHAQTRIGGEIVPKKRVWSWGPNTPHPGK